MRELASSDGRRHGPLLRPGAYTDSAVDGIRTQQLREPEPDARPAEGPREQLRVAVDP
jgi:hypothetical protein